MNNPRTRFLVKFAVVLVAAYLFIAWNPVNDHVIVPFTAALARSAAAILNAFGQHVTTIETTITSVAAIPGARAFAVTVNNGCNGIEAMLLLLAAIIAFPATLRARLIGLAIGALVVQLLNEVRIVSLWLIGAYKPGLFDLFHGAVWQIAIVLAAILWFVKWSATANETRPASST